jgi:hypothetical protein
MVMDQTAGKPNLVAGIRGKNIFPFCNLSNAAPVVNRWPSRPRNPIYNAYKIEKVWQSFL